MSNNKKHLSDLHFDHQLWLSELGFYEDELKIYQARLDEVAAKNTKTEVGKQIEHFQNQFFIQRKAMSDVKHIIKAEKNKLTDYAMQHPVAIDHVLFDNHTAMKENVDTFKNIYGDVKTEFRNFLHNTL